MEESLMTDPNQEVDQDLVRKQEGLHLDLLETRMEIDLVQDQSRMEGEMTIEDLFLHNFDNSSGNPV
jgi:hypothetical protein